MAHQLIKHLSARNNFTCLGVGKQKVPRNMPLDINVRPAFFIDIESELGKPVVTAACKIRFLVWYQSNICYLIGYGLITYTSHYRSNSMIRLLVPGMVS